MKKWKVVLDRFSPVRENGGRDFMDRKVIATCGKRGDAELICHELDKHYKVLTEDKRPDHSMYFLAVAQ